ncbi:MAG: hypothetical protein HQL59_13060, partial [Magnetococcales bacterium]|nr:hypothetical protein [Magnetococcales bacterium]
MRKRSLRPGDWIPVVHAACGDSPDEEDTRVQARAVVSALERLGFAGEVVELGEGLGGIRALVERAPAVVFNLVEAVGGVDRRAMEAAAAMEARGLILTGASSAVMAVVNSKLATKVALRRAGLPTPDWIEAGGPPGTVAVPAVGGESAPFPGDEGETAGGGGVAAGGEGVTAGGEGVTAGGESAT